ncbi:uncharacterized protein LODBEIA_P16230 [Lodderomyces beijingensis]|uniref:Arf-GAP domain-containing protein n=1 Tax=Lodderomyces beijingensis TaxID=1775926 RepID=A0ABP0ZHP1_9ASCO
MSKRHQKSIEKQLLDLVNSSGNNNKCGECGSTYPTWASYNLGIFLCGRCASVHKRILGPPNNDISKVKSLTLDNWTDEQVRRLSQIGNQKARRKWNSRKVPFPFDGNDDVSVVESYIRDKYILRKFRDDDSNTNDHFDNNGKSEYGDDRDGYLSSSGRRSTGNRSRSNSGFSSTAAGPVPRLTHRKLTTYEYTQYRVQVNKIRGFGYNDTDAILESLLLSSGNIDVALDILEQDAKINPRKEETAPSLPSRPRASTQASNSIPATANSAAASYDWLSDTPTPASVSNPAMSAMSAMPTGMPQIYQYTDPITGQISYVDSNGQEYLDPNNPQHQQQLMAMNNPQLMAQQTNKQNIMSLYSYPTGQPTGQPAGQPAAQQQQAQPNGLMQMQMQQQQPQFTGFGQPPQQQQFNGFAQQPQQSGFYGQPPQGYGRPY